MFFFIVYGESLNLPVIEGFRLEAEGLPTMDFEMNSDSMSNIYLMNGCLVERRPKPLCVVVQTTYWSSMITVPKSAISQKYKLIVWDKSEWLDNMEIIWYLHLIDYYGRVNRFKIVSVLK